MDRTLRLACTLFLAVTLLGCGGEGPDANGKGFGISGSRVINGVEVDEAASPQIKAVRIRYNDGSIGICSGVVVGRGSLLSAAHCYKDMVEAEIFLGGSWQRVEDILFAQGYVERPDLGAIFNDVAVLKAGTSLGPALSVLASEGEITAGATLTLFGFGLDENGEYGALKSGAIDVFEITPTHIVSFYKGKGSNSCLGDSGGPLVYFRPLPEGGFEPSVAGIVSTGTDETCGAGDLNFYINLSYPPIVRFLTLAVPDISFR